MCLTDFCCLGKFSCFSLCSLHFRPDVTRHGESRVPEQSAPVSQSAVGTYFSICSIKGWPFIIEKDSFVFSTLPARFQDQIQHFYGKLQSFWLMKSKDVQNNPGDPQLWRTGGVLQCCHCSPGRKERVRRTPGEKITTLSSKEAEKQRFFTGSGKVEETFSTSRRKQYLLGFFPSRCIQL